MIEGNYGMKSDIYAVGVVCLYLLRRKKTSKKSTLKSLFKKSLDYKIKYPPHVSSLCVSFLDDCLSYKPHNRSSISSLLSHPFFSLVSPLTKPSLQKSVTSLISPSDFQYGFLHLF